MRNTKFLRNGLYFLLLFCLNCSDKKIEKHSHTFYYWRSILSLDEAEQQALKAAEVNKLYVRLLDIDKQGNRFLPVGKVKKDSSFVLSQKIVPVVFITNRTWHHIKEEEIDLLADRTLHFIQEKYRQIFGGDFDEIQIDSDWTAKTQQDYFRFLKLLKKKSGKEITCTLRLHQVKDKEQTGIPPVNKTYLMCYATESPLQNSSRNSILDVDLLKNYLYRLDEYPLDFDVALPIYSWGIVNNHLGRKKLINALTTEELANNNAFRWIEKGLFEVEKDTFLHGIYLSKGFRVKVEEIRPDQLKEIIIFLDKKTKKSFHLIYYHLDSKFIQHFPELSN